MPPSPASPLSHTQQAAAKAEAEQAMKEKKQFSDLVKIKARHGYAPHSGGLETAASFFGNDGIFPTRVSRGRGREKKTVVER